MEEENVILFPAWKQAVENFLDEGFKPGDLITKDWLYKNFGLEEIKPETPTGKADQIRLAYLTCLENLKAILLSEHKALLINKRSIGYIYVEPENQAAVSEHQMHAEMKKALDRGACRMQHTDVGVLDTDQRKQHADAMARTAMLGSMMKKKRRILNRKTDLIEDLTEEQ
tara:strand:- start:2379 stop:2888 length:510 start_codon:yes stop_codon:yes gene_type:complete